MIFDYQSFIHLLFTGIIALFPVVNPIGSAFMVLPYLENLNDAEKKSAVRKIVVYAFVLCTLSLFAGHWILGLFGLSIPVVQLAGGIMICKMGWESLSAEKKEKNDKGIDATPEARDHFSDLQGKLFYPVTFPITTGAGTISVLFTLSAHTASKSFVGEIINCGAIMLAIIFMCLLVYLFYLNTRRIVRFLGNNGKVIIDRLTAFLIFCVGLQIASSGLFALIKLKFP